MSAPDNTVHTSSAWYSSYDYMIYGANKFSSFFIEPIYANVNDNSAGVSWVFHKGPGWLVLTLEGSLISHRDHRVLRESTFSQNTQEIAYLAPIGGCNHATRDCVWEGFERKKEWILFSLKTFSHKTVSNHFVTISLRGLCGLEHSWLQECGREVKTLWPV